MCVCLLDKELRNIERESVRQRYRKVERERERECVRQRYREVEREREMR